MVQKYSYRNSVNYWYRQEHFTEGTFTTFSWPLESYKSVLKTNSYNIWFGICWLLTESGVSTPWGICGCCPFAYLRCRHEFKHLGPELPTLLQICFNCLHRLILFCNRFLPFCLNILFCIFSFNIVISKLILIISLKVQPARKQARTNFVRSASRVPMGGGNRLPSRDTFAHLLLIPIKNIPDIYVFLALQAQSKLLTQIYLMLDQLSVQYTFTTDFH